MADAEPVEFRVAFRLKDGASPSANTFFTAAEWFKAQGFAVSGIDDHRLGFGAAGTVAQTRAALHVRFERIEVDGKSYLIASTAPSLPASVGQDVLGINGLQPFLRLNKGPAGMVPVSVKPFGH